MRLKEIVEILDAKVLTGEENMEIEVKSACGCDLMSDVLAFVKDQAVLLTGLINPQVIRTAEMMDMHAVIIVRGKTPDDSIIKLAKEREISLLSTPETLYVACGKLYASGLGLK